MNLEDEDTIEIGEMFDCSIGVEWNIQTTQIFSKSS